MHDETNGKLNSWGKKLTPRQILQGANSSENVKLLSHGLFLQLSSSLDPSKNLRFDTDELV